MKSLKAIVVKLLPVVIFSTYGALAQAIPKAAEDENAPVTTGADVAKPVHSKNQTKPNSVEKSKKSSTKKTAKSEKSGKPTQKAKSKHSKKSR